MPNATARGLIRYLRLKDGKKAKEFQKVEAEDWLKNKIKGIPLSDIE